MAINELFSEFPIINSENYIMRAVAEKDREQILSIYSDAEALKFQASRTISTIDEADDLIVNFTNGFERRLLIRWCIADKLNDEMVGLLALHHIDKANNKAQIGYILKRDLWNRGIMRSILSVFIDYLFPKGNLDKIEASIHPENQSSIKVVTRLGFVKEELLVNSVLNPINDVCEDRIIMALYNTEK